MLPLLKSTPTPYPDTPSPAEINAPLVELPALVSIQFLNELDGWGVTETQIVRTNDGGVTWYNVTPPEVTETGYSVDTFVLDNTHVWVQLADLENFPNSGSLYRTTDGGLTWTSNKVPFSRGDLNFLDPNNGWVMSVLGAAAGSMGISVFQTSDGGVTWDQTYTNDPNLADAGDSLPLGGQKSGLTALDMQTAWVYGLTYAPGTVYLYRTEDGGANWNEQSLPLPQGAENAELSVEKIAFIAPNFGFLTMRVTSDNINLAVYVSNDSGKTWSLTPTLIPGAGSADFSFQPMKQLFITAASFTSRAMRPAPGALSRRMCSSANPSQAWTLSTCRLAGSSQWTPPQIIVHFIEQAMEAQHGFPLFHNGHVMLREASV